MSEVVRVRGGSHVSGAGYCACSDARPVSESRAWPFRVSEEGYWCSVKAAGGDCLLCEVERVTAGVNKATRLIQVLMKAKEARFADCTCMSGS